MAEARALINGLSDKIELMAYYANINSAEKIKPILQAETSRVFDRPTPLIQNGMRIITDKSEFAVALGWKDVYSAGSMATAIRHRGRIYRDAVSQALIPNIEGVERQPKSFESWLRRSGIIAPDEWAIPTREAPLDGYGNVRGSMISKMLADLGAYGIVAGAPGTTKADKVEFYIGTIGGRGKFIFRTNKGRSRLRAYFIIVRGTPHYKPVFDFYGIAKREFSSRWEDEFNAVFERELSKR